MRLKRSFYARPTLEVAQNLLGKFLVRKVGGKKFSGMIVEVEAYKGHSDKASHASRGKTKRTEVMFGRAGLAYVYIVYGMYHCLNVVTEKEEYPSAVLIRAIANGHEFTTNDTNSISEIRGKLARPHRCASPARNRKAIALAGGLAKRCGRAHIRDLTNGPGKLCRAFKIDRKLNRVDLATSDKLWIEDRGVKIKKSQIVATKRIGVDYAGPYWSKRKWRFYIERNKFISKKQ